MKQAFYLFLIVGSFGCKKSTDTTTAVRKDITQAVYASGKIYPLNDYKVFTRLPGYVEKIHIAIGDEVKVGQALLTIRSEVSELNVSAAKNTLSLAQKNASESAPLLMSLKAGVAAGKSKYELDSINFHRLENLFKQNATSKNLYDQAATLFEVSKQSYLTALNGYKNTRDRLQVELENARIQYEAQLSNRSDYIISSVLNGKVYDVVPKEGELLNSQTPIMEIGEKGNYEVELNIDETDVSFIRKDQKIVYEIDAYKDKFLNGKILETYPRISPNNKTSKVISSIQIDSSMKIFSGMSVEANIIISEKRNALVIPREFLIEGNKVKIKSTGELVVIKKGVEDLESVEILSGLNESTEIVKK